MNYSVNNFVYWATKTIDPWLGFEGLKKVEKIDTWWQKIVFCFRSSWLSPIQKKSNRCKFFFHFIYQLWQKKCKFCLRRWFNCQSESTEKQWSLGRLWILYNNFATIIQPSFVDVEISIKRKTICESYKKCQQLPMRYETTSWKKSLAEIFTGG